MSEEDISYFRRRAEIESERARRATHREAAVVHDELAHAYRERIAAMDRKNAAPKKSRSKLSLPFEIQSGRTASASGRTHE